MLPNHGRAKFALEFFRFLDVLPRTSSPDFRPPDGTPPCRLPRFISRSAASPAPPIDARPLRPRQTRGLGGSTLFTSEKIIKSACRAGIFSHPSSAPPRVTPRFAIHRMSINQFYLACFAFACNGFLHGFPLPRAHHRPQRFSTNSWPSVSFCKAKPTFVRFMLGDL